MAARGRETLRHGPMKPFGLTNPHAPERKPYAVVQLRQDNAHGTLYNIVGFQTKLKHGAQKEVLRLISGLENAEFARLGGLHRNTFLNSPKLLDEQLRLRVQPRLRFAGQITGCEAYVESAAIGLITGRFAAAERRGETLAPLPVTTALGALIGHITRPHRDNRCRAALIPADECQFRFVSPARVRPESGGWAQTARPGESAGQEARIERTRRARSRDVDIRPAAPCSGMKRKCPAQGRAFPWSVRLKSVARDHRRRRTPIEVIVDAGASDHTVVAEARPRAGIRDCQARCTTRWPQRLDEDLVEGVRARS